MRVRKKGAFERAFGAATARSVRIGAEDPFQGPVGPLTNPGGPGEAPIPGFPTQPAPPAQPTIVIESSPLDRAISMAGAGIGAYHGYKRNGSIGWAIGWGLLGGMFPVFTTAIAFAQGIDKKG